MPKVKHPETGEIMIASPAGAKVLLERGWSNPDDVSVVEDRDEGYAALSPAELKAELKARDLPVSGKKADLIKRLEEHDAEQAEESSYDELDDDALRAALTERELDTEGEREELIARLEEHDAATGGD